MKDWRAKMIEFILNVVIALIITFSAIYLTIASVYEYLYFPGRRYKNYKEFKSNIKNSSHVVKLSYQEFKDYFKTDEKTGKNEWTIVTVNTTNEKGQKRIKYIHKIYYWPVRDIQFMIDLDFKSYCKLYKDLVQRHKDKITKEKIKDKNKIASDRKLFNDYVNKNKKDNEGNNNGY